MISKKLRGRLLYLAMSLFVAWHTIAMIIAPAPDNSAAVEPLRSLFRPYLSLFKMENTWGFFENIPRGPQFRYVVEDAAGKQHTFVPMDDFKWYHPRYNWFKMKYWAAMQSPELNGEFIALSSCREHAALNPASVVLLLVTEKDFRPEDLLQGHRPLDPEFVTVDTLMRVDCPK